MENSDIPYSERELIQRAIRQAKPFSGSYPRWVMVKRVFGTGYHASTAICEKYGFDPDKQIRIYDEISDKSYDENLMQHGIIR